MHLLLCPLYYLFRSELSHCIVLGSIYVLSSMWVLLSTMSDHTNVATTTIAWSITDSITKNFSLLRFQHFHYHRPFLFFDVTFTDHSWENNQIIRNEAFIDHTHFHFDINHF
ncbi:hypothetical protein AAZV13_13G164400 [Glycine max]